MKVCKVNPKASTCRVCLQAAVMYDMEAICSKCEEKNAEYELLQIACDVDGNDYAFLLKDGKINKVKLSRVFDVKEKECIF